MNNNFNERGTAEKDQRDAFSWVYVKPDEMVTQLRVFLVETFPCAPLRDYQD